MTSFIINKDLEPSTILGPPYINQLTRCISILLKTRINRKNRDGRIDLRIFKFSILWLAAASPQELRIWFLPVAVCVMAQKEWRGNSKIFEGEGLSRTSLMKMRLFLFTFYNINYNFISSLVEILNFDPLCRIYSDHKAKVIGQSSSKVYFLTKEEANYETSLTAFSGDNWLTGACIAILTPIPCWWQAGLLLLRDIKD